MSNTASIKDTERKLLDAGWKINATGNTVTYIEPRTGIGMTMFDAVALYMKHEEHGTKPLAVELGTPLHATAYVDFGKPEHRDSQTVQLPNGCRSMRAVSVWFPKEKECEQFLSKAGHEVKRNNKQTNNPS